MNLSRELLIGKIQVFDEDEFQPEVRTDVLDEAPQRRRGRPPGSCGRVNEDHDITLSDFSYLRAVIQGIEPKKAASRYLTGKIHLSIAACSEYEHRLRSILQRTIKVILDESEQNKAVGYLDVLNAPALQAVALGPTLEQFAERWDSDMYSESELQELYQEEYGGFLGEGQMGEGKDIGYGVKAKLDAINWLSDRIAKKPQSTDPLELWLDMNVISKLRLHGVISIGNLMDWVNIQGRTFHHQLKGFGVTRAKRLTLWLMDNEESIGQRLNRRVRFQTIDTSQATDIALVGTGSVGQQEFSIVPFEMLAWPASLLGHDGVFRGTKPNTFGATNDYEAIQAWFATLSETASAATQLSYKRAIERLVLWAIVEKRTPLSSLVTESFIAFREFLRNPPPHWCSRFPSIKGSPDWRPLRGPMKEASIQQTFSAISAFYSVLSSCGYLTANAVSSVRTSTKRDLRMDVMRSFAEEDLAAIKRTLDEIKDGPGKRRLRAIFLLLQTGGFRRGEAIALRYSHLSPIRKDNCISATWAAKFKGKGGHERQVPIKAETYDALQAHYRDRLDLIENGKEIIVDGARVIKEAPLAAYRGVSLEDTPLLSILNDRMAAGRAATAGEMAGNARVGVNVDGALSSGRIHSILKTFFQKVSERSDLVEGHANFMKASAHWLRHTFGHQSMIASDGDLASIQQILGHSDISTTGIYLKANMDSRVAVIEGIKAAV